MFLNQEKDGDNPPFKVEAKNVTFVPEQMVVVEGEMLTFGVTGTDTVKTRGLLITVFPVIQAAFEISSQTIISPVAIELSL